MKKVNCTYKGCSDRRAHWGRPDETRPHRQIEVADSHKGPMYCSIECACYDKAFSVRQETKKGRK